MMYDELYPTVGQALEPYRTDLVHRLWVVADTYSNIEVNPSELQQLAADLSAAFFAFLLDRQSTPTQLGEELNQIRATPMFLAGANKAVRQFCFAYLKAPHLSDEAHLVNEAHSPDEALIAGLEATADFFAYLVQVYVQTNQGMLQIKAVKRQEKLRLQSLLTDDEGTVLQHLIQGKTNKEIATAMGVSPRTVVNHLKQARQKLGVKTRTEMVVAAIRLFDPEQR